MRKTSMAIIGGTGLEALLKDTKQIRVGTPYGLPPAISVGKIDERAVAFLPRHGPSHSAPPHRVNYRANVYVLHEIGVKQIASTNAVGTINLDFKPGDLVIPHDLIDFTKCRDFTFYDEAPVTHIDLSQPYCPQIRGLLIEKAKDSGMKVWDRAVLACTEGPRYETPAEIEMLRRLGCDLVGMTGVPEAVLARELEMCYATLCFVSNLAAGMQRRLTANEVVSMAKKMLPAIQQILRETIKNLPEDRDCPCANALKDARLRC